jgi:hypothetical protein
VAGPGPRPRQLTVRQTVVEQQGGGCAPTEDQKSSSSGRTISIDQRTLDALKAHRDRQNDLRAMVGTRVAGPRSDLLPSRRPVAQPRPRDQALRSAREGRQASRGFGFTTPDMLTPAACCVSAFPPKSCPNDRTTARSRSPSTPTATSCPACSPTQPRSSQRWPSGPPPPAIHPSKTLPSTEARPIRGRPADGRS